MTSRKQPIPLDLDEMERTTDKHPDDRWGRLIRLHRASVVERDRYKELLTAALNVMSQVDDEEPGTESLDSLFDAEPDALDFWNNVMCDEKGTGGRR